jgi:hypothetical protein
LRKRDGLISMPRTARIVFPSMPFHLISRGDNREWVFHDEEDFDKYFELLKRYKEKNRFKLYHWVLGNEEYDSRPPWGKNEKGEDHE